MFWNKKQAETNKSDDSLYQVKKQLDVIDQIYAGGSGAEREISISSFQDPYHTVS